MGDQHSIENLLQRITELEKENATLKEQLLLISEHHNESQESNRLVSAYFDLSLVGMIIALPDLSMIKVNQKFCEIVGYSEEELKSMTWADITLPSDFKTEIVRYQRALDNKELMKSNQLKHFLRKDGSLVEVQLTTSFFRNSEGKVEQLAAMVQDLTERIEIEKNLAESEQRFKDLVDLLPQTVYETDLNGFFTFVNGHALREFGYEKDDVIGKMHFTQAITESERENAINNLKLNMSKGATGREYKMLRRDGTTFNGLIHYSPVIEMERVKGIRGIITNINHIKVIEQKLEDSEQRFRDLVNLIPQTVYETDERGVFTFVNKYAVTEFGYETDELYGKLSFLDMLTPDDRIEVARAFQSNLPVIGVGNQYNMLRKDGFVFPGLVHYTALVVDEKFKGFRGIITNILEQKQVETKLRESEENYHTIFELANDSIIVHNAETAEIIDANLNAIKSYGLNNLEELKNFGYWNESPYGLEEAKEWIRKVVLEGSQVFEWFNRRVDGSFFWEEVHLSNITILGNPRVISISRDITLRKKAEEELQKINRDLKERNEEYASLNEEYLSLNEALLNAKEKAEESDKLKSAFLANMSHEIRTPMNAIMGFSGLLASGQVKPEKQTLYSQIIRKRSSDLLKIIDDILDLSKIESNQLLLQPTNGNVRNTLNELHEFFLEKVEIDQTKRIDIRVVNSLNEDILNADFGRLKQILFNLAENAYKFTSEGSIEIGCRKRNESNEILFWVADTGLGIESHLQSKVFERFVQAHNRADQPAGGTGLGLTICKGLVSIMGGNIWLESEKGKGSTFYFTIPYNKASEIKLSFSPLVNTGALNQLPILIVEDDNVSANLLFDMLSPYKPQISFAKNCSEALISIKLMPQIKVILLDLKLPDFNGLEIIPEIKTLNPKAAIICQSAFATPDDIRAGLAAGCNAYITKPVDQNILLQTIANFV
jgi:PAS domain S-box-containing protein